MGLNGRVVLCLWEALDLVTSAEENKHPRDDFKSPVTNFIPQVRGRKRSYSQSVVVDTRHTLTEPIL